MRPFASRVLIVSRTTKRIEKQTRFNEQRRTNVFRNVRQRNENVIPVHAPTPRGRATRELFTDKNIYSLFLERTFHNRFRTKRHWAGHNKLTSEWTLSVRTGSRVWMDFGRLYVVGWFLFPGCRRSGTLVHERRQFVWYNGAAGSIDNRRKCAEAPNAADNNSYDRYR